MRIKSKLLLVLALLPVLLLFGCSRNSEKELRDFAVDNWSSGIGAIDENNLDNIDEQKFSHTLYLFSETDKLGEVSDVCPVIGGSLSNRVISEVLTEVIYTDDIIEVNGDVVFDARGLTKRDTFYETDPFITALKIITDDDSEFEVELKTHKFKFSD